MSAEARTPVTAASSAAAAAAAGIMSPPHLLAADGMPATPALHAPLAYPYSHATGTPAVTPAGGGGVGGGNSVTLGFPSTPITPGPLAPPMPSVHAHLSRLELDAAQLSRQYEGMLFSLQDSQKHMSQMTMHYVASLQQAVKSSSSSVGILIDTHTSLIRKMLIAVQQTEGIDTLETHIGATRAALTDLERSVEALLAEDALHATRQQLQQELHTPQDAIDDEYHSSGEEHEGQDSEDEDELDETAQRQRQRQRPRQLTPLHHEQPLSLSQPHTPSSSPHRRLTPRSRGHRTPTPQQPQLEAL